MTKLSYLFLTIIFLAFAHISYAHSEDLSIKALIGTNQILVVGESYGQIESSDYVAKIVSEYIADGSCLNIGLEIPSDQQQVLDSAMRGQDSMSNVNIDNVIDHDNYREMLVSFSDQIIAGKCLSVYAINPPTSMPVTKDAWMEQEVVKIVKDRPVLLLVQNKHAVKDFKYTDDPEMQLLTQRLRGRSFGVASVLQHWKPGVCMTKNVKFYDTSTDKKSAIYVKASIGELSAAMPEKASMVSDGVLVWSCDRITVKEIDTQTGDVANRKLIVEVSKYDVVERDEDVLKKIRWGIKHDYPIVGMNMDEAREAMGEPDQIEKASNVEKWIYECSDEDGFDYECYVLRFLDGSLVKFDNLE